MYASHISFKHQDVLKKVDTNNFVNRAEKMVWMLAANQASKAEVSQVKVILPKLNACSDFPKPLLDFMIELTKNE